MFGGDMNAVYLDKKGGVESLVAGDILKPQPKADEVLIKVHATAVMPTEFGWFTTFDLPTGGPRPYPIVLGHEFSGVVESLGANASGAKPGDSVFGINDWSINGAQAEYCVASVHGLAPKPQSLDHAQAATVPISALTAWQGLFGRLKLEKGQRILIHGATGAVGTFAVQLARSRGAYIIATASTANLTLAHDLGADEVIDYRTTRFDDVVRDMDAVFDGVGGDTLDRSWNVLGKNGKLVTIASNIAPENTRGRAAFMLVEASAAQLREIAELIDAGKLRVFVEDVFPLTKAREAYVRAGKGNMQGKIALRVANP